MMRYEFEVLSHLERNGAGQYPLRALSDALTISGGEISRCLEQLTAENWITRDGDTLAVTETGLAALEPYRVKSAIILAAGFGSRMMPALTAVGIRDITIVRGYRKECFDALLEKYPFLTLVDNDIYSKTNNISSVMAVLDKLDGCYLCEADLYITNPQIITKYQYASNILGAYSLETDDWCFQMDGNGHIINYQKGNTFCYNYYGISYWTQADSARLREDFRQVYGEDGGKDYFWEFIPLVLRKERYAVEIRRCRKSDIMEIDNYYELAQLDPTYRAAPDREGTL